MSKALYEALGSEKSRARFKRDGMHRNHDGNRKLAKSMVEGIKASQLDIAKYLGTDVTGFDPSRLIHSKRLRCLPAR